MNSAAIKQHPFFYHLIALITVSIWGTTFVSTKVLLLNGISASQIMVYRFTLAYILMLPMAKQFRSNSLRDEFMFLLLGICGGSLYFYTENMALEYTLVTNVSLILCLAPVLTLILCRIFLRTVKITREVIVGSVVALVGVSLVVFNGNYILKLSPVGDILTFIAAFSWAVYSVVIKKLESRYTTSFMTRKVFFYGVITLLPLTLTQGDLFDVDLLVNLVVIANLLFLGVIASLICFLLWNKAVRELGTTSTNNYIYLSPIAALAASHIVLDEPVTFVAIIGAVFILSGVYYVEKGMKIIAALKSNNLFKNITI